MEPPNLTTKRIRIAENGVTHGINILASANGLKTLKDERAQAGDFEDSEMTTPKLLPVTAFMAGQLFDFLQADLETWMNGKLDNNVANPTRREFLNKLTGG